MVQVFHEVKRVLRKDGTCWVNMGDCYSGSGRGADAKYANQSLSEDSERIKPDWDICGLKPKDLVGQPWRLAFALQADGWYLRSDIIWAKPNPMPESVTDRPTKAHEYIFLLSKSPRYFYDQEAVREKNVNPDRTNYAPGKEAYSVGNIHGPNDSRASRNDGFKAYAEGKTCNGRNSRTVWEIATQPYPEAHFATFPEELPRRCIKAGTSEKGCCPKCGSPWERKTEDLEPVQQHWAPGTQEKAAIAQGPHGKTSVINTGFITPKKSIGWQPTCSCGLTETVPCVVLDPFAGSGTTGAVARGMGRSSVLIELNPEYVKLIRERCETNHIALEAFEQTEPEASK
jgi:DNA modification methylase